MEQIRVTLSLDKDTYDMLVEMAKAEDVTGNLSSVSRKIIRLVYNTVFKPARLELEKAG